MSTVTFITGNPDKAEYMAKYLDYPVAHQKIELDELQSLNLHEIAEHKVRQAYEKVKSPVLVEDGGLFIRSLGDLPGPFIRWFEKSLGLADICKLVKNDRYAVFKLCYAYFDGQQVHFFDGALEGDITNEPRGNGGFGFDPLFIPKGASKTLAEMDDGETRSFAIRSKILFPQLKEFLASLDKIK